MQPSWGTRDQAPDEQVDALFRDFIIGRRMAYPGALKDIKPHHEGVWELKTADVRIFGWFVARDEFVAVAAGDATSIKARRLYGQLRRETVRFRNDLDLNDPKFVTGDIGDVLSIHR